MKSKTTNTQRLKGIIEKNVASETAKEQALNYVKLIKLQMEFVQANLTLKNEIIQTKSAQIMDLNERFLGKRFPIAKCLKDSKKGSETMKRMRKEQWVKHKIMLANLRNKLEQLETEAQKNIEVLGK